MRANKLLSKPLTELLPVQTFNKTGQVFSPHLSTCDSLIDLSSFTSRLGPGSCLLYAAAFKQVSCPAHANLIRAFRERAKTITQSCVITVECEILLLSCLLARYPSFCPAPQQRLLCRQAGGKEQLGCIASIHKRSILSSLGEMNQV